MKLHLLIDFSIEEKFLLLQVLMSRNSTNLLALYGTNGNNWPNMIVP